MLENVLKRFHTGGRFEYLLQNVAGQFEDGNLCAEHVKCETLMPKDLDLMRKLRGESV